MNLPLYLTRSTRRLSERLTKLRAKRRSHQVDGYMRALLLLRNAAMNLLRNLQLEATEIDAKGSFWSSGPELIVPERTDPSPKRFTRLQVTKYNGRDLDPLQQILLLELQAVVFLYLESLGAPGGDDLLDLSAGGFARFPVARLAMHVAGHAAWSDELFWRCDIVPAGIFTVRLLTDLERMLSRTCENKPVTTSVFILNTEVSNRLRWTNWVQPFDELFSGDKSDDKCGLRLSDGESTTFAFSFSGDFLGFFDTEELHSIIRATEDQSFFRWKVLPDRTIAGVANDELRITYSQGSWRYIDHSGLLERLTQTEPSLGAETGRVWELCLAMSRRREGALVLIVREPSKLLEDGVCMPGELNTKLPSRLIERFGPEPETPTLRGDVEWLESVKPYLLEQYRGRALRDLTLNQLIGLARLDGAIVVDCSGIILGFGIILRAPHTPTAMDVGARTTAARAASSYGLAIKVSEDGPIAAFFEGSPLQ